MNIEYHFKHPKTSIIVVQHEKGIIRFVFQHPLLEGRRANTTRVNLSGTIPITYIFYYLQSTGWNKFIFSSLLAL